MRATSKEDLWSTLDAEQEIARCEQVPGGKWRGERTFVVRGRDRLREREHEFCLEMALAALVYSW